MPPEIGGDWGEYRRLVLAELQRIATDMENLAQKIEKFRTDEIAQIKTDIALLKLQAGLWGAAAGVAGTLLVSIFPKLIGK